MGDRIVDLAAAGPLAVRESWGGAAERGLQARQEREAIVSRVLRPGSDFGMIPGTQKPTLLKPGAEKIADSLNLYTDYEPITKVEDWEKPLFHYSYRCVLRARGSESTVAMGLGSCNSMEARYRWRDEQRKCPKCGVAAIIKGKQEYGGGWLCFVKKGGCNAKFSDTHQDIMSQKAGKVPNDDVYSLVNTIDKMAQKRALVAATLNLGFSEQFTQDLEDVAGAEVEAAPVDEPPHTVETEAPADWIIDFGRYKGQKIRVIDDGYLHWLIAEGDKALADPAKARNKGKNEANMRRFLMEKQRRAVMAAEAEAATLNDPADLFPIGDERAEPPPGALSSDR